MDLGLLIGKFQSRRSEMRLRRLAGIGECFLSGPGPASPLREQDRTKFTMATM
jgi:hypothetical protein